MSSSHWEGLKFWLKGWVECGALPGAALGIFDHHGDELFYHEESSHHLKQNYQRNTLYRIYSMTKPITTLAILILLERGVLTLEDELGQWIPAFQTYPMNVIKGGNLEEPLLEPLQQPLRLIHLLTQTSGIAYGIFGNNLGDQFLKLHAGEHWKTWYSQLTLEQLSEVVAKSPLLFQPGTAFHYGLSTDILGYVVERASGKTLDKFFMEEIFQPLGMKETFFQVPPELAHRLADCYEVAPGKTCRLSTNAERDRLQPRVLLTGGGGLVSTMADYARFATFLVNKGRLGDIRLVREETIDLMAKNHLPDNKDIASFSFEAGFSEAMGPGQGFGLGVSCVTDNNQLKGGSISHVGEYGWGGVAATYFFIDPVRKISSIFMTQVMPAAAEYPLRAQQRYLTLHCVDLERKLQQAKEGQELQG